MFVTELEKAKAMCKGSSSIVRFLVRLENGEYLLLYLVTDLCLLSICENIRKWYKSIIEYCTVNGLNYSCIVLISYVE